MKPRFPAYLLSVLLVAICTCRPQDDPPLKAEDKILLKIRRATESEETNGDDPFPPPQIMISGQVRNPGGVPFTENLNLISAIDLAGGFTGSARLTRIKLIRNGGTILIDLRKLERDGSNVPKIQKGDHITVP